LRAKGSEADGKSKGKQKDFFEIRDGDGQNGNGDEPELRKHVGGCGGVHRGSPWGLVAKVPGE
jgi:hypothetical protein